MFPVRMLDEGRAGEKEAREGDDVGGMGFGDGGCGGCFRGWEWESWGDCSGFSWWLVAKILLSIL